MYDGGPSYIYTEGKEYPIVCFVTDNTRVMTDSKKYFELIDKFLAKSREIGFGRNQTEEQLQAHIENNKVSERARELYEIEIPIDFVNITDNKGSYQRFCVSTLEEIKKKYHLKEVEFSYSVDMIEEYFDYIPIRREKKLNRILK